jgi:hypothetical protein
MTSTPSRSPFDSTAAPSTKTFTEHLSNASEQISHVATSTKRTIQGGLASTKQFLTTRSTTFWIVLGVFLVTVVGVSIYYAVTYHRHWVRYVDCPGCYRRYPDMNANITDRAPIESNVLSQPQSGYTYSMWLYVANWYSSTSYKKWKPVYCRADIPDGCGTLEWDKVPFQQPGIWLAPTSNAMRVVVTTTARAPTCNSQASDDTRSCGSSPSSDAEGSNINILEYVDLQDIPIGKWFHLCIVVTSQRVELYMNGLLVQTSILVGSCEVNSDECTIENGYFAPGTVKYSARLSNFRYMPRPMPSQMVRLLHEVESSNPVLKEANPLDALES